MRPPVTREDALAFLVEHYFTPGEIAQAKASFDPLATLRTAATRVRRGYVAADKPCYDSHYGDAVNVFRPYTWGPGVKPAFVISFSELAKACMPQPVAAVEEPMQRSMF